MEQHDDAITKLPAPVLRGRAQELAPEEIRAPKTAALIRRMSAALRETPDGVGIAAPQIGAGLRIFIASEEAEEIDRRMRSGKTASAPKPESGAEPDGVKPYPERHWKHYVFINPVARKASRRKQDDVEGCLSVPGVYGTVARSEKITVAAYDEAGNRFTRGASGFFARVLQHELDHLDGVLFIDKVKEVIKPRPQRGA